MQTATQRIQMFGKEHIPVFPEGSPELQFVARSRMFYLPENGYARPIRVDKTTGRETFAQAKEQGIFGEVDDSLSFLPSCLMSTPVHRVVAGEQVSDARLCQTFCMIRKADERLNTTGQINNFCSKFGDEIRTVGRVLFPTFVGRDRSNICFVGVSVTKNGTLRAEKFDLLDRKMWPAGTWKIVIQYC